MDSIMRLLLVSGSTRQSSTNNAALATVRELAPEGSSAILYEGLSTLPHFNPDDDRDPIPAAVASLREQIRQADAVVFSTPEYAGTLPGSFTNLLDWTVGSDVVSGKPVAWITVAARGRGRGAIATLASVRGYLDAQVLDRACIDLPIARDMIQAGLVSPRPERVALARWWTVMQDQRETRD
jgi:NAD(P)H-dependent FMN reductase